MQEEEFQSLLEVLESIGQHGPLSRFGQDLNNIEELPTKGYRKGARVFYDPVADVRYVSNSSGWVRRYVPTKWCGTDITSRYTLNQRKKSKPEKYWKTKGILLETEEERIQLIVRGIRNYRKTLKKFYESRGK